MSTVVFVKQPKHLSEALEEFRFDCNNKTIPLKVHMGEPKNLYFPRPKDVNILADKLREWGAKPVLYDTTVAYSSPRNSAAGYESVASAHGFDKIAEILIEEKGLVKKVQGFDFEVGLFLTQSSCVAAFSHVKGHCSTGMGGTIKNFGMGGVTKQTKKWMHDASRPVFDESTCSLCGRCADVCICDAISIDDDAWLWEEWKCFGCGVCVLNCPKDALSFQIEDFQFLLSCAAKAALFEKKGIYVNELRRIAKDCDCTPGGGPLLCADLGFVIGSDPVAVDTASLDIIDKQFGDIFLKSHHVDPYLHVKCAEKIGLGSTKYTLKEW